MKEIFKAGIKGAGVVAVSMAIVFAVAKLIAAGAESAGAPGVAGAVRKVYPI